MTRHHYLLQFTNIQVVHFSKVLKVFIFIAIFSISIGIFLLIIAKKSELYHSDTELGTRAPLNQSVEMTKIHKEQLIYQVRYDFDEYGRRKTPVLNQESKKFAIFFGGSNTFGEGLTIEKTLPYLFSKKNPQFRSYNYAFPGWGPNNTLRRLQTSNIKFQVPEKEGLVVYHYFNFHLMRVLGTIQYFSWSWGQAPSYQWIDGKLKHRGLFYRSRPFYFLLLKGLSIPGVFQYFKRDLPHSQSDYSIDLSCAIFKEMKKIMEQQFSKVDFLVLVSLKSEKKDRFIKWCLVKNKIAFLNSRKIWKGNFSETTIMGKIEHHYNLKVNEFLANTLSNWLKEKNQRK